MVLAVPENEVKSSDAVGFWWISGQLKRAGAFVSPLFHLTQQDFISEWLVRIHESLILAIPLLSPLRSWSDHCEAEVELPCLPVSSALQRKSMDT